MNIITNKSIWLSALIKVVATLLFCNLVFNHSYDKPYYNYDSIPYVASAKYLETKDYEISHKYSYELLKKKAPQFYNGLCCSGAYRNSMSSDYEAFASHMPAYQIKSLYVQLIRITSDSLGVDEYKAINIISLSSVLGIVFVFASFFFQLNIFGFLSIFGVLVLSQVLHLSRLMTPDALSSLAFLSSVVLILKNLKIAGFFLLILALLVRPSNIVYTGLIPLFLLKDRKFIYFILLSTVSLFVYYLNAKVVGGLGWWKSFHSSLIGMPTTFIGYDPPFDLNQYLESLNYWFFWTLTDWNYNRWLAIALSFSIGSIYLMQKNKGYLKNEVLIFASFSFGVLISFILFPIADHRIYSSGLLPATFLFLFFMFKPQKN